VTARLGTWHQGGSAAGLRSEAQGASGGTIGYLETLAWLKKVAFPAG
jgi:hypothetical protein